MKKQLKKWLGCKPECEDIPRSPGLVIESKGIDAWDYLNNILTSDYETEIPFGYYYVKKPLVSEKSKHYNWNGSVIYTDKDIDLFLSRGTKYSHSNLILDKSLVKDPRPWLSVLRIQGKGENMMNYKFVNLRLRGSSNALWSDRGNLGNTGIIFDNKADIGNPNVKRENHWGQFDIQEAAGLYRVFDLNKTEYDLAHSRIDFFINASLVKQIGRIIDVNGVNIHFKYSCPPVLLEAEKEMPLLHVDGQRVSIRKEVVDFDKKPIEKPGRAKKYYHRWKIENFKTQVIVNDEIFDQNETKERKYNIEHAKLNYK